MANINNTVATVNNNANKPAFSQFMQSNLARTMMTNVLRGENIDKFATSIITVVANNPSLQDCSHMSILSGAMQAHALKLSASPQLGQCYLVPFNNKSGKSAQFIVGYRGLIQMAIRSGFYKNLNILPIKAGELIKFNPLTEELEVNLIEDDLIRDKVDTIGYYAFLEYHNGFKKAIYWTKNKMEAHAIRYSKGYQAKKGYTFWETDFDGMAMKTMLRQLISKWGAMSIDMQTALERDESVLETKDGNIIEATVEETTQNDDDHSYTISSSDGVKSEMTTGNSDDEQVASFFKK
jgi:recombination protein RecT